ncbi:MAG: amidase [Mesorhizobium sp.]|nr:MAG: amidase [Mesorhizobium sp.]
MPKNALPRTITELRRQIETKALTIDDIRLDVKTRLDANKGLNAFITVMLEDTSKGRTALPLSGVPVGLKDFFDTAGVRTTAASEKFANRVPAEDASLVRRLRSAGALIVGKTNMHTLGMGTTSLESYFGPVRNPWMKDRVAGGSSGGSAAAVASGICFATIDTDAVGSARLPAACCAVTAFKPSYGRISSDGILRGEPVDPAILALNHTSITARSVEDVAVVFGILAEGILAEPKAKVRLGLVGNYSASDAMKRKFESSMPFIKSIVDSSMEVTVPFSEARFDPSGIKSARDAINERLFSDVDLIMLPTLVDPVPTVEQARRDGDQAVSPANTFFANYFGLPAITIPFEFDDQLGPIALQIVGPAGADLGVLDFGRRIQERRQPSFGGEATRPDGVPFHDGGQNP